MYVKEVKTTFIYMMNCLRFRKGKMCHKLCFILGKVSLHMVYMSLVIIMAPPK